MKKNIAVLAGVLSLLLALSACTQALPEAAHTPQPVFAGQAQAGSVALLAQKLGDALGIRLYPTDAQAPATGSAAARLAVRALGLDVRAALAQPGVPLDDAAYLSLAVENGLAPAELFVAEAMDDAHMDAFADEVARAADQLVFDKAAQGTEIPATVSMDIVCQIAVMAYNPQAQGQGVYRYGQDNGSLAYWTLASYGALQAVQSAGEELSFVTLQNKGKQMSLSADAQKFTQSLKELWGISSWEGQEGLRVQEDQVYLGERVEDSFRQVPALYRAERIGEYVRCTVDVFNDDRWAGKAHIWLFENARSLLGWQIAAIEPLGSAPIPFAAAQFSAEQKGVSALIDADVSTVWTLAREAQEPMLTLRFSQPTAISGLAVYNGDHSDAAALAKSGRAGVIGIRINGQDEELLRYDLSAQQMLVPGEATGIPFGREITVQELVVVFYGETSRDISVSGIVAF